MQAPDAIMVLLFADANLMFGNVPTLTLQLQATLVRVCNKNMLQGL